MLKTFQENLGSAKYWAGNGFTSDHDDLVRRHAPFVHAIAREYYHPSAGISYEDLLQEGFMGLLEAAVRFRPERGYKFVTYASWWIRKPILRLITEQSQNIKIPAYRWPRILSDRRGDGESCSTLPAAHNGKDDRAKLRSLPAGDCASISRGEVSLDETVESETAWKDRLRDEKTLDPATQAQHSETMQLLGRALATLTTRERAIISLRFGLDGSEPLTLQDIGARLGLSRERVRQLECRALERLMQLILPAREVRPA